MIQKINGLKYIRTINIWNINYEFNYFVYNEIHNKIKVLHWSWSLRRMVIFVTEKFHWEYAKAAMSRAVHLRVGAFTVLESDYKYK